MKNKLVNSLWDFIKRPALAALVIFPPVLGFRAYNEGNSVEKGVLNFRYQGMEARVVTIDYPLTGIMSHVELEDGSRVSQGRLISDEGDTISVYNGYYAINGVEQR